MPNFRANHANELFVSPQGLRPSPGGLRDHVSKLPSVLGRRHSGEMHEGQYYTESEGSERIRHVRDGTVAPIPEKSQ